MAFKTHARGSTLSFYDLLALPCNHALRCSTVTVLHCSLTRVHSDTSHAGMLIQVEATSDTKEFCMIEFQGEIKHEKGLTKGFIAGALSPHTFKKDTVELQVGYHRLEGTRVAIKKPLLVLYKEFSPRGEALYQTKGGSNW